MKKTTLYIALISQILIGCGKTDKKNNLKTDGLNHKEIKIAKDYIDTLKLKNPVFSILIEKLNDSKQFVIIHFSATVKIGGFRPKQSSSLNLYFNSLNEFLDENVALEEFFHAFQATFYGQDAMLPDENAYIKGAPNLEYEAKLFKALTALQNDQAYFETPSQKGLLDFALNLLDKSGKLKSYKLDSLQQNQYIRLVRHFQLHWKKEIVMNRYKVSMITQLTLN